MTVGLIVIRTIIAGVWVAFFQECQQQSCGQDTACPPSSVYAAYNALGGPKRMHVDVAAGHTNTPEAGAATTEAIRQHFAVMTTGRPRVDVA